MKNDNNLNWHYMIYNNDSWKSKLFKLDSKVYLLRSYSDLYDVVKYKDSERIKSAKRNITLYEVPCGALNIALITNTEFGNMAGIIERVGISILPSVKKSFDGYIDEGLKTLPTELEPTYERRKYKYNLVDSGEVIINLNNKKLLVNIENGNCKMYQDAGSNGIKTNYNNEIALGDFLKSYTGNVRIIDVLEVPGRKVYSGKYMKKVPQILYEGTLTSSDLGVDILDKSILDRKIQLVSLPNSNTGTRVPALEIILKQSK